VTIDATHDLRRRSWVPSANEPGTDFPIQNLPLGVFRRAGDDRDRIGVAIGTEILDLAAWADSRHIGGDFANVCREDRLNALMARGPAFRASLREAVAAFLLADHPAEPGLLVAASDVRLQLPVRIGDYTDFYASIHHATRVGALLRPEQPLLPNYKWVPIAYHGRASSIVVTGTPVRRPIGQTHGEGADAPRVGPTRRLDYEAEVGFFVAAGNALGVPIPITSAEAYLAGVCLVNDWSARDVQKWEYQPLGPFLAKSFATTISPWVVTPEALAPFRAPLAARAPGDPAPLSYLDDPEDRRAGGFDIRVETRISTRAMREQGMAPMLVGAASLLDLYWSPAQMLAHHTGNGCNLNPGDLFASGTVSGPALESAGCLLERTAGGRDALALPTGETRRFLEDGDEVTMRAHCARDGFARIGFGECRGEISPASER
jgi:fumarylacetoacetase